MPNVVIVGQRRQGKSTLALAEASTKGNTVIIWDPNDNYPHPAIETVRPNASWGGPFRTLDEFMESAAADPHQIHLARLGPVDQADIDAHFAATAETLWGWTDYVLIVDESMLLQKPSRLDPSLDRFLRRSPSDVYVIQTCHRLFELHALSRYLVDEVIVFRLELPRERDLIAKQFDERLAVEVAELGDREYAKWQRSNTGRTGFYRQPDATVWYVDLGNRNTRERRRDFETAGSKVEQANATTREATLGPEDDTDGSNDGIDTDPAAAAVGFAPGPG